MQWWSISLFLLYLDVFRGTYGNYAMMTILVVKHVIILMILIWVIVKCFDPRTRFLFSQKSRNIAMNFFFLPCASFRFPRCYSNHYCHFFQDNYCYCIIIFILMTHYLSFNYLYCDYPNNNHYSNYQMFSMCSLKRHTFPAFRFFRCYYKYCHRFLFQNNYCFRIIIFILMRSIFLFIINNLIILIVVDNK